MKEKERNKDYSRRSLTLVFIGVTCPEVEGAIIHFSNGVVLQAELIG